MRIHQKSSTKKVMAGSRTEKIGTIFSRVRGLLRTGAMKDADKPVWYDIYERFPPKVEPSYERLQDEERVTDILYQEDIIRSKFYKIFGSPDVIDMKNYTAVPVSQRFIQMYTELEQSSTKQPDVIFETVVEQLQHEGIKLKTLEEIQREKKLKMLMAMKENEAKQSDLKEPQQAANIKELFGKEYQKSLADEPDSAPDDEYQPPR